MNNFGVIEVASTKTRNAPGWAYVPDNAPNPSATAFPTSRKNRAARNTAALGLSDLSARQDAKVRKDLEALDKEPSTRDVAIPARSGKAQAKHTPNVRKILQSQKTFANHLDDYIAFQAVARDNPQATAPWAPPAPAATANNLKRSTSSSHKAKPKTPAPPAAPPKPEVAQQDIDMSDAPHHPTDEPHLAAPLTSYPPDTTLLPAYARAPPRPHPGDADPLLVSRAVPFPTDAELRALVAAPPLTYLEARATVDHGVVGAGGPYPERKFCEVCGYWGRVKCGKCGGRVCALDCLETHREECLRRYGL
ncbi:hypothetical protein CONLIGDRAFT_626728 [Coniochaeta ligniaria NRRL 30616]|uniref:HIT-type domain-containing protein n=1 Tax=Coniochaeta ligniaria NRRL 30616 TaxID=1408157 RepID=A0A1J7J3N2_9PEZI|nr:hypothetical protein CONLIGDRAFT_626728 [Coniochaeta ligniaria NRRL 30616]